MLFRSWKQELVKRAGELFARGKAPAVEDAQKVIDDLHRKIGQLASAVECGRESEPAAAPDFWTAG